MNIFFPLLVCVKLLFLFFKLTINAKKIINKNIKNKTFILKKSKNINGIYFINTKLNRIENKKNKNKKNKKTKLFCDNNDNVNIMEQPNNSVNISKDNNSFIYLNRKKMTNLLLIVNYDGTNYNGWTGLENSSEVYLNALQNYKNRKKTERQKYIERKKYTTVQNNILDCILKLHGYKYIHNNNNNEHIYNSYDNDETNNSNSAHLNDHNQNNISNIINNKPFEFIGVSRTDKGVHAKEYICQYISYEKEPPCDGNMEHIKRSLNSLLNKDIKILAVLKSPHDNFNIRFHNSGKIYTYNLDIRNPSQPLERNYAWQLYDDPRFFFLSKKTKKHNKEKTQNDIHTILQTCAIPGDENGKKGLYITSKKEEDIKDIYVEGLTHLFEEDYISNGTYDDEVMSDETQNYIGGDIISSNNISSNNISSNNISSNNISINNISSNNISSNNISSNNISSNNISSNNISSNNISSNNISTNNISTNNIPIDNISSNNIPIDNISSNNISTNNIPPSNDPPYDNPTSDPPLFYNKNMKSSYNDISYSIKIINREKEIRSVIPCDINKIKECAKLFIGHHNFECFRGTLKGTEKLRKINTYCTIHFLDVYELKNNLYQFVIQGDRFLYHMIRIIVGTLVQVGVGLLNIEDVRDALYLCKPLKVKLCAPSQGLCLNKILLQEPLDKLVGSALISN
ncbi:tRNA pseudouridine synthase,putative [Plasmodium sp. gorilla clade G2]|uniref:tRNA pseudouridine synthase,putative n=1 Tax=Plasmodium sp. gorilla clade G2 TaxID=880535 RepID=UPI000D1FE159|nr:tRNA pseudouridine synthase,putative [Plasmodium sp. gorilla clade G2]SOV11710.1 tRNA pseudouridine synthase,putative [Plasmodium sp. gorilla clade G2]